MIVTGIHGSVNFAACPHHFGVHTLFWAYSGIEPETSYKYKESWDEFKAKTLPPNYRSSMPVYFQVYWI